MIKDFTVYEDESATHIKLYSVGAFSIGAISKNVNKVSRDIGNNAESIITTPQQTSFQTIVEFMSRLQSLIGLEINPLEGFISGATDVKFWEFNKHRMKMLEKVHFQNLITEESSDDFVERVCEFLNLNPTLHHLDLQNNSFFEMQVNAVRNAWNNRGLLIE
jgi:hypothetical protein